MRIEDLKVGDELVCVDRDGFLNERRNAEYLLHNKMIVTDVNEHETYLLCEKDEKSCRNYIYSHELKYFKKKDKSLQFSDLEVGDYAYVRDDLVEFQDYGDNSYVDELGGGYGCITDIDNNQFEINNTGYYATPEMLDLSRSMKKEDYLKMNEVKEKEGHTFNDLIGVAVQAVKDKLIVDLKINLGQIAFYVKSNRDYQEFTDFSDALLFINSLYKETFVIESIEQMNKITFKQDAKITLSNGEVLHESVICSLSKFNNDVAFCVLKGATVEQDRYVCKRLDINYIEHLL